MVAIVSTRLSGTDPRTHAGTQARAHLLTQPPTNGRITISPPTLLRGDNINNAKKSENLGCLHTKRFHRLPYWFCAPVMQTGQKLDAPEFFSMALKLYGTQKRETDEKMREPKDKHMKMFSLLEIGQYIRSMLKMHAEVK